MSPLSHRATRSAAIFLLCLSVTAWPNVTLRAHASAAITAVVAPLLGLVTFGKGGRAELRSAPVVEVRRPGDHVTSDAALVLHGAARPGRPFVFGLSLRRDFQLPLALFAATVAAAPISAKRRLAAIVLGFPLVFLGCFSLLLATICWLFALGVPSIYTLQGSTLELLHVFASIFLFPPTLRLFGAVAIAAGVLWSVRGTTLCGSAQPATAHGTLDRPFDSSTCDAPADR